MNSVQLIGNLTNKPELKYLSNGTPFAEFSIAVNEVFYTGAEGNRTKNEKVHFIQCQAWQGMGENITKFFEKGQKIGVTGSIKQDRWEKDGKNHSKLFVRVDGFDFCGGKPGEKTNDAEHSDPDWSGTPKRDAPKPQTVPRDPDLDPDKNDDLPYD